MPTVILRGSKNGHAVSRLVLEGSSSNPVRWADLDGEPVKVTVKEFKKLDRNYVLESVDKPDDTEETPPEPEQGGDGDDNQETIPEKGGVK
jgi:hypothetical protein